jgi:transposase-like protein
VARALFGGKGNPYLYLDATYLKVRWGSSVSSLPLLACVGVEDTGDSQR